MPVYLNLWSPAPLELHLRLTREEESSQKQNRNQRGKMHWLWAVGLWMRTLGKYVQLLKTHHKNVFGSECSFSGIFKREAGCFYLYLKISLFNTLLRTGVVIILRVFETLQFCWKPFFVPVYRVGWNVKMLTFILFSLLLVDGYCFEGQNLYKTFMKMYFQRQLVCGLY